MNIGSILKPSGARARLFRSLLWPVPFVAGFWLWRHSWREAALLVIALCYLTVFESVADRMSPRSRYLAVAPLFIGVIIAALLLT